MQPDPWRAVGASAPSIKSLDVMGGRSLQRDRAGLLWMLIWAYSHVGSLTLPRHWGSSSPITPWLTSPCALVSSFISQEAACPAQISAPAHVVDQGRQVPSSYRADVLGRGAGQQAVTNKHKYEPNSPS